MHFVCWLWRGKNFWKTVAKYDERHVEALSSMLKRHGGHELICVQDGNFDIPGSIIMPEEVAELPDYLPKLWCFSPEFHRIMGGRFASIDLDVVITDDLSPLLNVNEPFVIWNQAKGEPYNTSLFALEAGYHQHVWKSMSVDKVSAARRQYARWTGDQSWVAHILGSDEPTFGEQDGVLQYRPSVHRMEKPRNMKTMFLCGPYEPESESMKSEWMRQAWK